MHSFMHYSLLTCNNARSRLLAGWGSCLSGELGPKYTDGIDEGLRSDLRSSRIPLLTELPAGLDSHHVDKPFPEPQVGTRAEREGVQSPAVVRYLRPTAPSIPASPVGPDAPSRRQDRPEPPEREDGHA
jgi:hypothetical protein